MLSCLALCYKETGLSAFLCLFDQCAGFNCTELTVAWNILLQIMLKRSVHTHNAGFMKAITSSMAKHDDFYVKWCLVKSAELCGVVHQTPEQLREHVLWVSLNPAGGRWEGCLGCPGVRCWALVLLICPGERQFSKGVWDWSGPLRRLHFAPAWPPCRVRQHHTCPPVRLSWSKPIGLWVFGFFVYFCSQSLIRILLQLGGALAEGQRWGLMNSHLT